MFIYGDAPYRCETKCQQVKIIFPNNILLICSWKWYIFINTIHVLQFKYFEHRYAHYPQLIQQIWRYHEVCVVTLSGHDFDLQKSMPAVSHIVPICGVRYWMFNWIRGMSFFIAKLTDWHWNVTNSRTDGKKTWSEPQLQVFMSSYHVISTWLD